MLKQKSNGVPSGNQFFLTLPYHKVERFHHVTCCHQFPGRIYLHYFSFPGNLPLILDKLAFLFLEGFFAFSCHPIAMCANGTKRRIGPLFLNIIHNLFNALGYKFRNTFPGKGSCKSVGLMALKRHDLRSSLLRMKKQRMS